MRIVKTHRIAVRAIALAAVTTALSGAATAQLPASDASATPPVAVAATDASGALSLEEAVILALEHNELVMIAEEGERRAQAVKREVGAVGFPQVTVSGQAVRQKELKTAFSTGGTPMSITLQAPHSEVASAELTQLLDIFGHVRRARRIAGLGAQIEALNVVRSRSEITYEARTSFYDVLRASGGVDVAQAAVIDAEEQLRLARSFVTAGAAPPFDVTRADVALAERRQTLISAQNSLTLAGAAFNNILGRNVESPVHIRAVTDAPKRSVDIAGQTERALAARPEIVQLELGVEARRETVRLQRLGNMPTVAIVGNATHLFNPSGLGANDNNWTAGVAATWPLWDSGATRARVDQAQSDVKTLELQTEQMRRGVALEVRQAGLSVEEAADRFAVADKAVGQAEEALRLARTRYQNGVSAQIEVLDAETALIAARFSRNNARYDHLAARAAFDRALMGRFSNSTGS